MAAAALAMLAACGGGGGSGSDPIANPPTNPPTDPPTNPPPTGGGPFTLGGTLVASGNLVLDADINDPNQVDRRSNDSLDTAQPVAATAQILGTVNLPFAGPDGASRTGGDLDDYYRVTLVAGQTVTLDFTADPTVNDIDLYVYQRIDGWPVIVGLSIGLGPSECVRITESGEYYLNPYAYDGASLYNLRVSAPGAGGACDNSTSMAMAQHAGGFAADRLIVGLRDEPDAARRAERRARAARAADMAGLRLQRGTLEPGRLAMMTLPDSAERRRQVLGAGARAAAARPAAGTALAWAERQRQTIGFVKRLRASGAFDHVLFDHTLRASALVGPFPPDDPRYANQRWHYEQIALPAAMNRLATLSPQPAQRPVVAVLDTGIVAEHPDLAPQLVAGFDFIADPASAGDGNGLDPDPDDLRSPAQQPSFHGTHVAGTVAAATFDGRGAAGVAPMAQLMPLRVLGAGGSGSFYDILQALLYASGQPNDAGRLPARRADVINLSLGASGLACDADTERVFAGIRARGSLVVAAAGNDADRDRGQVIGVGYPANCPSVIAVAATDAQVGMAPYSNGGPQVAVAAPGGNTRRSTTGTGLPDGVYSTLAAFDPNGTRVPTFAAYQGTSMATPHVAGVLALMRWVHPQISADDIGSLLAQGAMVDDAGAPGRDTDYGWGVINAAKAVQAALALRDGTPPPADGVLLLQPAALDFGTQATSLEFVLAASGPTDEALRSITASDPAVSVAAVATNPTSGLGRWRVTVDRSRLTPGVRVASVTLVTTARTLTLQLTMEQRPADTAGADLGPIYVLLLDGVSGQTLDGQRVLPAAGSYRWQLGDVRAASVIVVAGSDIDNDGFICSRGELCGGYPVLGTQLSPVVVDRNRSDLGFVLAPVGAGNVDEARDAAAGAAPQAGALQSGRLPARGLARPPAGTVLPAIPAPR